MLRWCVASLLAGALAAAVAAGIVQLRTNARTEEARARATVLEAGLGPDAEARAAVQSLEACRVHLRRLIDTVNSLKQAQPDLEAVDRAVLDAAGRVRGIRLESAQWSRGKVRVTVRAASVEALARAGEALARHGSFAGTTIKRWAGEEEGDRFVVVTTWAPPGEPKRPVGGLLRVPGDE